MLGRGCQSSLLAAPARLCPCSLAPTPGTSKPLFQLFCSPLKAALLAVVSGCEAGLLWVSRACTGLVSGLVCVPGAVAAPGRAQGSHQVSRLILAACRARPISSRALAQEQEEFLGFATGLTLGKVLVGGFASVT